MINKGTRLSLVYQGTGPSAPMMEDTEHWSLVKVVRLRNRRGQKYNSVKYAVIHQAFMKITAGYFMNNHQATKMY